MVKYFNELLQLFQGFADAYGTYKLAGPGIAGEKNVGKATTLKQPLTAKNWELHLRGVMGLGVIPITEKNEVKFGAIDVDVYPLDHAELIQKIEKAKMPLVVCRTKSGGAHCFLFLKEFTSAKLVQTKLREMAVLLGYGSSEIFPKQVEILVERGDIGQWINMPYFDFEKTERYAFSSEGKMLDLDSFVKYAEMRRITGAELEKWNTTVREALPGGPPCLQVLCAQGFPQGTRNNGMYNLGVYAQKAFPDEWEKKVVDYNHLYLDPPLPPEEIMGIIKSLKKKEYNYSCDQSPIQQHCNANKCRGCKFGIGGGMGLPVLGTLTKLETKPPIWFLDVDSGRRMELTSEQLQSPRLFQLACIETLSMMPIMPKAEVWGSMVQRLLENASVVEVSRDNTPEGQLMDHLDRFCTGKAQAKTVDEILLGKPWTNGGSHYFRVTDFVQYLDRVKFRYDGPRWLTRVLRDNKGTHKFFNIKGKGVNCWCVPEFTPMDGKFLPPNQVDQTPFE